MNILVVVGCCLLENSSANLCHRSYINGMIDLGNDVDLLCYSQENIKIDKGLKLPAINNIYEYNGVSLYEKLARKSNMGKNISVTTESKLENKAKKQGLKCKVINKLKRIIRSSYGIYNPSIVWYRRAKKFKSDKHYDLLVSLSYPQVSHYLASYLVNKNRVKCDRWIQVWEDPWTCDLYNKDNKKKCYKAEKKLLQKGREIVYVSPITLKKQQEFFSDNSEKMRWLPIPFYYKNNEVEYKNAENHYGYFGDYFSTVRNIIPFYKVAVEKHIKVNICGSPYGLLKNENNVNVYPRLPLNELKIFEDDTNVIVCLFNLGGGQIPGKIYQYTATNKIILGILDGPKDEQKVIRDYFDQFNRIIFCENTEKSISEAIKKIENGDFGNIKNESLRDFSSKNIVKKLIG